jgi:hypothetical protein
MAKEQIIHLIHGQTNWTQLPKEEIQIVNKDIKKCSASLAIKE